eukprot:g7255.t1
MGAGASADAPSFDDIDISKWSKEQVADEVAGLGKAFEEYKEMAIDNEIDGKALAVLTGEDLESAGMDKRLHREAILAKVQELSSSRAAAGPDARTELRRPTFVPPKDLAASAEARARLLALEAELAAAPAADAMAAEQHAAIEDCFGAVRAVLDDAVAQADVDELRTVLMTEGGLHRDAYAACHAIVATDDGYECFLAAAKDAEARFPGVHGGARLCFQSVAQLGALYEQARKVLPLFQQQMRTIADSFAHLPSGKHGEPRVKLHFGDLKHLYRCMEKMCFKQGENRYQCESVCDVVRCIVECDDVGLMEQVLQAISSCPELAVQRVKDRANKLTSMKWMDIMMNVTLVGDGYSHVCEIQVVHSKMLVARSGLGGHQPYARLRGAAEILEVLGVDVPLFGAAAAAIPSAVPDLPDVMCERSSVVAELRKRLFEESDGTAAVSLSSVKSTKLATHGQGGVGKTTMAVAIVHDATVRRSFERIAWVSVGEAPAIMEMQRALFAQLMGKPMMAKDDATADSQLEELQAACKGKRWLVVLDDVWDRVHEKLLNCVDAESASKLLVTTRIRGLLAGCDEVSLNLMTHSESVDLLLRTGAVEDLTDAEANTAAAHIADLCGHLPLYLSICGGIIADFEGGAEWQAELVEMLKEDRVGVMDDAGDDDTAGRIVDASLSSLKNKDAEMLFQSLAVCPEDVLVPVPVAQLLCKADSDNSSKTTPIVVRRSLKKLLDRNLLQGSTTAGVQMHDIVRDLMRARLGDEGAIRTKQRAFVAEVAASCPAEGWASDDDVARYAAKALRQHMCEALLPNPAEDTEAQAWLDVSNDVLSHLFVRCAADAFGPAQLIALGERCEAAGQALVAAKRFTSAAMTDVLSHVGHSGFHKSVAAGTSAGDDVPAEIDLLMRAVELLVGVEQSTETRILEVALRGRIGGRLPFTHPFNAKSPARMLKLIEAGVEVVSPTMKIAIGFAR